ncbi:hypothetical protein ACRRTK_002412 [Alexandromys fortis]
MLLLYEFEVKTKTNDPSLYSFMDSVWKMPDIESRTLETIALLAMDKPAHYPAIARKALTRLLFIHKNKQPIDVLKYSECMRNLIELLVSDAVSSIVLYSLREIWDHLKNALSLISQTEGYPEEEILWLMIKSWNTGILMYSRNMYDSAKRWAGLALDFLGHLGSLKTSYEAKLQHPLSHSSCDLVPLRSKSQIPIPERPGPCRVAFSAGLKGLDLNFTSRGVPVHPFLSTLPILCISFIAFALSTWVWGEQQNCSQKEGQMGKPSSHVLSKGNYEGGVGISRQRTKTQGICEGAGGAFRESKWLEEAAMEEKAKG